MRLMNDNFNGFASPKDKNTLKIHDLKKLIIF